jgi:hypothetical protein
VTLLGVEFVVLGALDVLFVLLAIDVLHHGEGWAGYLNSAHGAGGVAVGVLAAAIVGRRFGPVVVVTAGLMGIALAATAFVTSDVLVLGLLALVGANRSLFDIATRSLLQRAVAADMVARVFGLVEGLTLAGAAIGALLVPLLVEGTGDSRIALLVVAATVPCVVLGRLRALLRIDEAAHVPVVEISLLRSTPVFRALPAPALEGVARALQRVELGPGSEIIRQGDEANTHYFVLADGAVQIQQDGHPIRELGRGSGIGEIALLHGGPRTASALALTPVTLYSLDRESFLISLQGHAVSFSAAHHAAAEHLAGDADRAARPRPQLGVASARATGKKRRGRGIGRR